MNEKMASEALSPEQYGALKRALELGKWPDGQPLSEAQKATCMQAVIYWDARHATAQQRTGFIDRGPKASGDSCPEPEPLRFTND